MRRVHREATECVLFIGSQPACAEQAMEARPSVPKNGGNGLVFDRPRWKRDPVHREATDWVGMHPFQREATGLDGTGDGNEA